MKKALSFGSHILLVAAVFDIAILFASLAQVALEGRTGSWNPFWRWQAEQVVRLLVAVK